LSGTLRKERPDCKDCAQRVRYRLVPECVGERFSGRMIRA
jgi:hypothetical protein